MALVFLGVFGYVLIVNNGSVKGFEVSKLEKQIAALNLENQNLNARLESAKSLTSLEEKVKDLKMVSVSGIEYVNVAGPVAMAK